MTSPWYMKHSYYGVFNKYMTLVLGNWKFATDKPLALRVRGLSVANFLWSQTWVVHLLNIPTSRGMYIYSIPAYFDFNRRRNHLSLACFLISFLSLILKFEFIIALVVTYSWEQEVHRFAIPCVRSTFCMNNSVLKWYI